MENPVNRGLQERRRRILASTRIALPQHPSDFGVRRPVRLREEAARHLEWVGNRLELKTTSAVMN